MTLPGLSKMLLLIFVMIFVILYFSVVITYVLRADIFLSLDWKVLGIT